MGKAAGGERGGQHKNKRESWARAGCRIAPGAGRPVGKVNSALSRWQHFLLTAAFFLCFIEFLQRVQQFLWGEDVRGPCRGRGRWGGGSVMASGPPLRPGRRPRCPQSPPARPYLAATAPRAGGNACKKMYIYGGGGIVG